MSDEVEQFLRAAVEHENDGNIQEAFDLYQAALAMLLEDAKNEPDESRRAALQRIATRYIKVAESLKEQLRGQPTQSLSLSSPTTATTATTNKPVTSKPASGDKSNIWTLGGLMAKSKPTATTSSSATPRKPSSVTHYNTIPDDHDYSAPGTGVRGRTSVAPVSTASGGKARSRTPGGTSASTASTAQVTTKANRINPSSAATNTTSRASTSASVTPARPTTFTVSNGSSPRPNGTISNSQSTAIDKSKVKANPSSEENNKLAEYEQQIQSEMLDSSPGVRWDDISGLAYAKQTLQEAVILPNLRPDLFTGLRAPPRGVLLFGPPGTGKTLLAKAVATESGFAFFSITASSVTSKYLGEGEKLMKALFAVARRLEPAVIFLDEIDSLMSARKENEHEASRRVKTEFMTQVDGATTGGEERLLIMGATNIPWELDEAVLRRLVKRIYVPLPDEVARRSLITHLILKHLRSANKNTDNGTASDTASVGHARDDSSKSATGSRSTLQISPESAKSNSSMFSSITSLVLGPDTKGSPQHQGQTPSGQSRSLVPGQSLGQSAAGFSEADMARIVALTEGYSGSDLTAVCHEAAMGPIRELGFAALKTVRPEDVRPLNVRDFEAAVINIRPSVSQDSLQQYTKWGDQFGVVK